MLLRQRRIRFMEGAVPESLSRIAADTFTLPRRGAAVTKVPAKTEPWQRSVL